MGDGVEVANPQVGERETEENRKAYCYPWIGTQTGFFGRLGWFSSNGGKVAYIQ